MKEIPLTNGRVALCANEESKPAAQQTLSDGAQFFACYLIDNCENEVVREESVQAWLGKMLASPRYHPAAPSVEQDERGAFEAWARDEGMDLERGIIGAGAYNDSSTQACWRGWKHRARAASTSANVAQLQSVDLPPRVIDQLYQAAGVSTYHPDGDQQEKLHAFARNVVAETLARLPTANVAQGAVAVATVKVYETYTGQNGWTEVTQEEYDRTKDKYEHRIRRVPAPPAQTALTVTPAMVKAAMPWLTGLHHMRNTDAKAHIKEAIKAALAAAQSASGDMK